MKKIAIDCGHGLRTSGKQTPDGVKEWELNDKVRDKVVQKLSSYDCEIIFPDNDEGNVDESLSSRLNMYIKAGVDAAVSIHHNALKGTWCNAAGCEVWVDRNNTTADMKLAEAIYSRLPKYTELKGRGIKKENWYVINQNKIPAVLVEGGFMDGIEDYKIITSDAGQEGYANAVAEGLIEFLGLEKKSRGITYRAHIQNVGWQGWKSNGETAGTIGQSKRMEAIIIDGDAKFTYQVHCQGKGDMPPVTNGQIAGTTGQGLRMEAINIECDKPINYRVHVQGIGWMPWVSNGVWTGTRGQSRRMEAIEIKLV